MPESNSSGEETSYRKLGSPLNFSKDENNHSGSGGGGAERMDVSPVVPNAEVHTIELSNDSNESSQERNGNEDEKKTTPPARIYLKQDLVKPENLKPEMLMRFR